MMKSLLLIVILASLITSCSNIKEHDTSTAVGAFKQAEEFEKAERYDEAIDRYRNVKLKFPYSQYARTSDLKVADLYFKKESYVEAEAAYQIYKDFYPQDSIVDYVTFRIGLSYFNQLPDVVGRDLSAAKDAIQVFNELEASYPNSKHLKEALKLRTKAYKMLADKELYIADFYLIRKNYKSALGRYKFVLKQFPNVGHNKRALYGAVKSAQKAELNDEAKKLGQELVRLFKNSKEAKEIRQDILK